MQEGAGARIERHDGVGVLVGAGADLREEVGGRIAGRYIQGASDGIERIGRPARRPARGTESFTGGQVVLAGPVDGTRSKLHTRSPERASNAMMRPVTP
jgi:hypothetical protein